MNLCMSARKINITVMLRYKLINCAIILITIMMCLNLFSTSVKANSIVANTEETLDWSKALITEWTIPVNIDGEGLGTTIKLPITANTINSYTVDWGDGSVFESFDSTASFPTHNYKNTEVKTYTIRVTGTINSFGYANWWNMPTATNDTKNYYTFTQYITGLKQWGELESRRYGFSYCTKLAGTIPSPTPNSFKNITDMGDLFRLCSSLTGNIPEDLFSYTTCITNFANTFVDCSGLTGEIPKDLFATHPNVERFDSVFGGCKKLTGSIPVEIFSRNTKATIFNSTFSGCSSLTGEIPENLFINNKNVTSLRAVFYGCGNLTGTIPENLFKYNTLATDFDSTFCGCGKLTGTIPENLFANNPLTTNFYYTFARCGSLTGPIPENLFANNPLVTNFAFTFCWDGGLTGEIPENLFANNPKVTSFQATFSECKNITGSIPEKLFYNNPEVTSFYHTFWYCKGLTGQIPENLFSKNIVAKSFSAIFEHCSNLTGTIPEKLFANNVEATSFSATFGSCSNLTGNISENLFINNTKATDFSRTFDHVSNLTGEISEKLFSTTTLVTTFNGTFSGCSKLTGSIPENLFANTPLVTDFGRTFWKCSGLTGDIPVKLFANTPLVTQFSDVFGSCSNLTGEIPLSFFGNNTGVTIIPTEFNWANGEDAFKYAFSGTKITKVEIDTLYLGYQMFAGCNQLTEIKIGNKVQVIGTDAFQASSPYSATKLLKTNLDTQNNVATFYDWLGDYREINDLNAFTTEWTVPVGARIKLPIPQNELNHFKVNWGDGMVEILDNTANFPSHTYTNTEEKVYEIQISGKVSEFGTYDLNSAPTSNSDYYTFTQYTTGLKRWGEIGATRYGFAYCENLTGEIPETTDTTFNNVTSMKDMFKNCDGITGNIPSEFFDSMTSEVSVPADLTTSSEEDVYNSTFYECKNITGVNIDTEYVGYQMFYGANKLTNIQVGDNVQVIGTEAFQATAPYSPTNILETKVTTTNEVATAYNWVEANRDALDGMSIITEWTIPVDANGEGLGTTILLPIAKHENNSYVVDWGDGVIEVFDNTADYPSHRYTNTEETTYTIKVSGTLDGFGYYQWNDQPPALAETDKRYTFTQYLTGLISWGEVGATRYGFAQCKNLSSTIPEPTENTFKNVVIIHSLFFQCSKLVGPIPENLFASAINATEFQFIFGECHNLTGSIPDKLFEKTINATNMGGLFTNCYNLTGSIPEKLFENTPKANGFATCFVSCSKLRGEIPEKLFANTPNVTSFYRTFTNCSGLTGSIPEKLFEKTTKATNFEETFRLCSGLNGAIPENLFASMPEVTNFAKTFQDCRNLSGSIPKNLFVKNVNVNTFSETFNRCSSLTGSIPAELFASAINANNFSNTFNGCSNLTGSIPKELFANALAANWFGGTFRDCYNLNGSIPSELFAKTTNAKSFDYTFSGCKGLTGNIPADLFKNTPLVTSFKYTFSDCSKLTGNIPVDLFEKTPLVKSFAFAFNNCSALMGEISSDLFAANTAITTIPTEWKAYNNEDAFESTFMNCSGIEKADIDILYAGYRMFLGCNNLDDISIGNNMQAIGNDAFEATSPYSSTNLLTTILRTTNSVATNYDWRSDNRDMKDPTALITEWTIPINVDKTNGTTTTNASGDTITLGPQTTIKLPIPSSTSNSYVVDWGDGSALETFDGTANFPTHTYKNTEVKVYTIKIIGKVNSFGYTGTINPTASNNQKNYYPFTKYVTQLIQWGELEVRRYGFSFCQTLAGTIPSPTENSFKNTSDMGYLFYYCYRLNGEIPEDLFTNATNVKTFDHTFCNCSGLIGTIPENLFVNNREVDSFRGTFSYCSNIVGPIPEKLFINNSKVTIVSHCFSNCANLTGPIPENLFANMPEITTCVSLFQYDRKLTGEISGKLFKNNTKIIKFTTVFGDCESLTGIIPEEIFSYAPNAELFDWTFAGCKNLTGTIPANLFANNPKARDFTGTFANTPKITGSIPENLFLANENATVFNGTFNGCSGLTGEIPENLFSTNKLVTTFESTFRNCSSLSGNIPESLFTNNTVVKDFDSTFEGCSNLEGHISENLFENNSSIRYLTATFRNCSNLTSLNINTSFVGNNMFYGCNKLTDITIGDNVQSINYNAFEATTPYTKETPLITNLTTTNEVALSYDWVSDNRSDGKYIISQPEDVTIKEYNDANFTVVASGDYLEYQWYEIPVGYSSEDSIKLTEENTRILKSNIEGQANKVATTKIIIKSTESNTLSFEYMVSSEIDNDVFKVTVEDSNGIVTAVDNISGEVNWSNYSKECVPTSSGEIIITITYSKNDKVDVSGDYGAIRRLKYSGENLKKFTFEEDSNFEIDPEFAIIMPVHSEEYAYTIKEEDGEKILEATNYNEVNQYTSAAFGMMLTEESTFTMEYRINGSDGDHYTYIALDDGNGQNQILSGTESTDGWIKYTTTVIPNGYGMATLEVATCPQQELSDSNNTVAIRNIGIIAGRKIISTFENDESFVIENTNSEFETVNYIGTNTSILTIPAKQVPLSMNGSKYYCEVSNTFGPIITREALLTVEESYDWNKSLITEWTIPADVNGNGLGTTINLPIEMNVYNNFRVNWGDGSEIEAFYGNANFPEHTYMNTMETTYEISIVGTVKHFGYAATTIPTLTEKAEYYTFTQYLTELIAWGEVNANQYAFSCCSNLVGAIPEPTEASFIEVIRFTQLFYNCDKLIGPIPENLFVNCENPIDFYDTFGNCRSLKGTIPENLFENAKTTSNFDGAFRNCISLTGNIPANLFETCEGIKTLRNTFEGCIGLNGSIPKNLFSNCKDINSFYGTFSGCSGLEGSIPKELFASCASAEDFSQTFKGCIGLSGNIPAELFANNKLATSMNSVFSSCTGLSGLIPEKLFKNNALVKSYKATFEKCTSLKGGELQINTDEVTNMDSMFYGCTALENIVLGENFKNLDGTNMFKNCSALRAIIMLNNPETINDVGIIANVDTLALANGTTIYVPYEEDEILYQEKNTNIAEERIEQVIEAIEPNPDHVGLHQEYIDPGYTVAGYSIDEKTAWEQYGFYVEIRGNPVDTSEPGSEWIKYILKRN